MSKHPFSRVALAAAYNTAQSRDLHGHTSLSISVEAALGAIQVCGLRIEDIDGIASPDAAELGHALGIGPFMPLQGISASIATILEAASAIESGIASTFLVVGGGAGLYADHSSTAPWTRPENEFVGSIGIYTAVEFALIARRHMHKFGTTPEQLAAVAATIRNNGSINPDAVLTGRGPYKVEDILASRLIADPFHLLDCCITSEGACALILTTWDRASDTDTTPVSILGGGIDRLGPPYQQPPSWDAVGRNHDIPLGYIGRRAARLSFETAGLSPEEIDVCEFYDPFSFEIIRQLEAFEFCGEGEGGLFVEEGNIGASGRLPVTTDGGLLSYSHPGRSAQALQRVARAVHQIQNCCATNQVDGAETAMSSNYGAGAFGSEVIILGKERV